MTAYEESKISLKELFDAIPKAKFSRVFGPASNVELTLGRMAQLLSKLREYFLETTGEESPFVSKIDELVPRPATEPK